MPPVSDFERFGILQRWTITELFDHTERLQVGGDAASASAAYKGWIARNADHQLLHAVYFNYGVALAKSGDRMGAINATRECIRIKPDFQPPYINLGRLLEDAGESRAAVAQWQALTSRLGEVNGEAVKHKLMALEQLARVLEAHLIDGPAEEALRQSIEISVAQPAIVQHWIALRQRQCKWPIVAGWGHVKEDALMASISPLSLANLIDDPMHQLAQARRYHDDLVAPLGKSRPVPTYSPARDHASRKLRVGYVSSDFREHAVGFAMTDVMETHDRTRFEIHAYYCGVSRVDDIRSRIRESVDRWVDINGLSDEQAAACIRDDEIDILVDLNGYTKDARTRVFALRPAPIAVNWFGFPGSMGSPDHHYIIADEHIIPEHSELYYSEQVLRLSCYQPNDRKRRISVVRPTRAEEGLPDGALVYCCLNGVQKLTSRTFAGWLTVLAKVPEAVLWLLGGGEEPNARLRAVAEQQGVARERLVFAEKRANPEHVARYALADLFLDTFPYGAHTTAADALWMGVPVLTFPGKCFASRVCSSLVIAAGIGDFVCADEKEYVARAIELGRNPEQLASVKRRLRSGRGDCRLFDTPQLVREMEELYLTMWEDFRHGRRPIPDLTNFELYREIGCEIACENVQDMSDDEYRSLYVGKIAARNAISPIPLDKRLWRGGF